MQKNAAICGKDVATCAKGAALCARPRPRPAREEVELDVGVGGVQRVGGRADGRREDGGGADAAQNRLEHLQPGREAL